VSPRDIIQRRYSGGGSAPRSGGSVHDI
jgi:hypothetical protein